MTDSEVKCLCAHMLFWREGLRTALCDLTLDLSLSEAVKELKKRNWFYEEVTDSLIWSTK